jgi:hypothetical protein
MTRQTEFWAMRPNCLHGIAIADTRRATAHGGLRKAINETVGLYVRYSDNARVLIERLESSHAMQGVMTPGVPMALASEPVAACSPLTTERRAKPALS